MPMLSGSGQVYLLYSNVASFYNRGRTYDDSTILERKSPGEIVFLNACTVRYVFAYFFEHFSCWKMHEFISEFVKVLTTFIKGHYKKWEKQRVVGGCYCFVRSIWKR